MAKKIAVINLKGGVGKTTTTVGVATMLSGVQGKNTLVVDLDPQTNATIALIGEDDWKVLDESGLTLETVFRCAMAGGAPVDINRIIRKGVGNIAEARSIDLLPSSLGMIDIQDRLASTHGALYNDSPTDILMRAIGDVESDYDYILIDCPPNLGLITLNGLRIADGYIIPTIPDYMSTYGIPQIVNRVRAFSQQIHRNIRCYGVVATRVRNCRAHWVTLERLRKGYDAPLFGARLAESSRISEAAESMSVHTLKQKWGYGGQYDQLNALATELIWRAET